MKKSYIKKKKTPQTEVFSSKKDKILSLTFIELLCQDNTYLEQKVR